MSRLFGYILRFAVIIAGYGGASLAASAFIHLLFIGSQDFAADQVPALVAGSFVLSVPFVALFVAYFAFVPSLIIILIAEFLGRRDWLSYALGGAIAGASVISMFWTATAPMLDDEAVIDPMLMEPRFVALMLGTGIVGGLAYWLIAGRWAGRTGSIGPAPSES